MADGASARRDGSADLPGATPDALANILERLVREGYSGPGCVVDCQATLIRLAGDWELFRDLLQFYCDDVPRLTIAIREAVAARDADRLQYAVHQLKGLIGNFDAQRAVEAANQLQQMADRGELLGAEQTFVRLERELTAADDVLRQLRRPVIRP